MATKTIWDLAKGDNFRLRESGLTCVVVTPTEDGKGLVARYVDGDLQGQEDFVFDEEIDFTTAKDTESV